MTFSKFGSYGLSLSWPPTSIAKSSSPSARLSRSSSSLGRITPDDLPIARIFSLVTNLSRIRIITWRKHPAPASKLVEQPALLHSAVGGRSIHARADAHPVAGLLRIFARHEFGPNASLKAMRLPPGAARRPPFKEFWSLKKSRCLFPLTFSPSIEYW